MSQTPQVSLPNHSTRSQGTEYSFFYKPPNDFQIYNVTCKEMTISFDLVSQLLNNNNISSNLYVFYFPQFVQKKIYQVTCELVSHSLIIQFLNVNIHGIEVKKNDQEGYVNFSRELRENLEFHLKQFLAQYLASK